MITETTNLEVSEIDFSEFESLPLAEPVAATDLIEEPSRDRTPETKDCEVCGKVISREPGKRGRLPRAHPECRSVKTTTRSTSGSGNKLTAATKRKEEEAEQAVALFRAAIVKVALGIALVDKYDGFCIMSALPNACQNLKGVLVAHDGLRRDLLSLKSGGSIIGLVFSGLVMVVPILAHHGLIPSQHISQMLVNLPLVLHKVAQRMREGEQALTDMMERAASQAVKDFTTEHSPNASADN